jgi:hypothetical protein
MSTELRYKRLNMNTIGILLKALHLIK